MHKKDCMHWSAQPPNPFRHCETTATNLDSRRRALKLGCYSMENLETDEDAKDQKRGKITPWPGWNDLVDGALGARSTLV